MNDDKLSGEMRDGYLTEMRTPDGEPLCSCPAVHRHVLMIVDGPPRAAVVVCEEQDCPNVECWRKETVS